MTLIVVRWHILDILGDHVKKITVTDPGYCVLLSFSSHFILVGGTLTRTFECEL
jgi:hypothetical protein